MSARHTGAARSDEKSVGAPGTDERPRIATRPNLPPIELGPIIKSKIQPPSLRASTLSRQRLIDQLRDATSRRLTLLIAEAGYGKTTLLADFAAKSGMRTFWYRLDSTDGDVITWANHIIGAVREIEPHFGEATLRLMSQLATGGPPKSAFISSVIGELGELEPVQSLLVLDDFHAVDENADAIEFVARLAKDSPPWLHVVVSARRKPNLELARITASGELAEIITDELRFTRDETMQLFAESYLTPLDEDVLADLDARTKGWVASLQLFHGSIRGRSQAAVRALTRALSGASSPIYDFLAEEVLGNLPPHLETFLIRCSILDQISAEIVVALFGDAAEPPSTHQTRAWIDEADRLSLLTRSSATSDSRQLHPLMRDFVARQLHSLETDAAIAQMHRRVATSLAVSDPLTAAGHYVEAGDESSAMRCLGSSLMLTMGTGQWGLATELIKRVRQVAAEPAVAAIRARHLIEEGDFEEARTVLDAVDLVDASPDVRAAVRHARLSLAFRSSDRSLLFATLTDIQSESDTPPVFAEIFQIYLDASPLSLTPVPFAALARRMERMAIAQREAGYLFFAAISFHNAAQTLLAAYRLDDAMRLGDEALSAFDAIPHIDHDKYSTHAILGTILLEYGDVTQAEEHFRAAVASGVERADVHAEYAYSLASTGDFVRANQLLLSAEERDRDGRSDLAARMLLAFTRALTAAGDTPTYSIELLNATPTEIALDTGYVLERQMLLSLCELLAGQHSDAFRIAEVARDQAAARGAGRVLTRLELVLSMAQRDATSFRQALSLAAERGEGGLLTAAEAVCRHLWLVPDVPPQILASVQRWPHRWLPILRRQLNEGGTANAFVAARILDAEGESSDVMRLRAFAKTYRKQSKTASGLGLQLARRVAPVLEIHDLGRTQLRIAGRTIDVAKLRRKSGALLMYLVTRPGYTANREQALDQLWPESDPHAAINNLNQALFFLRRDIDPWHEDDLSVDYVGLQGDVIWLNAQLISVSSARFVAAVQSRMTDHVVGSDPRGLISQYAGQFCPEFEYEDWALAWRASVHAAFLEFATWSIDLLVANHDLESARDVAAAALQRDRTATDLERKLVWLYWHIGARSAAAAQYAHLASLDVADGLDPEPIERLVAAVKP